MKFRKDFVTNSSSSSFIAVEVKSKDFVDIIVKAAKGLNEILGDCISINTVENTMIIQNYEGFVPDCPESIYDFIENFIWFLEETSECYADDDIQDLLEMIEELKDRKESLSDKFERIFWETGHYGWGGDDSERYSQSAYSSESLLRVKKSILSEHPELTDIEEITDEMFYDFVSDKTNSVECKFEYKDGKIETSIDHFLE